MSRDFDVSMTYTNTAGQTVEFRACGPWHYGATDVHDYKWTYDTVASRSANFRRAPRDLSIRAHLDGGGAGERDRATDVFDLDVAAGTPGTLRVGASELRCYVTGSSKDSWWYDGGSMTADLTLHADDPVWTRERTLQFFPDGGAPYSSAYLDYPIGYPFDYSRNRRPAEFRAPFDAPCAFRLTVYGPAENPYVIVGGNRYQVEASLLEGDLLIVDSMAKTVTLRDVDGGETSLFASAVREDGARIFKDMPGGASAVSWTGAFGFDITFIERRSEPAWT